VYSGGFAEGVILTLQQMFSVKVHKHDVLKKLVTTNKIIIKTTVKILDKTYKFAVCGSSGARHLFTTAAFREYDFIEVMVCPGGCINGGGQPKKASQMLVSESRRPSRDMEFTSSPSGPLSSKALTNQSRSMAINPSAVSAHFEPRQVLKPEESVVSTFPVVAYGSTRGKATKLARIIAGFMNCNSCSINQLESIEAMFQRRRVVFIISASGVGEYPLNSACFVKKLSKTKKSLAGFEFACLGLGRSSYGESFAFAGRQLFELLVKKGAKPLIPFATCDDSAENGGMGQFIQFSKDLAAALFIERPNIGARPVAQVSVVEDSSILERPPRPIGFEMAQIVQREVLSGEDEVPAFYGYVLKLPEGMTYENGDHVTILPENDCLVVKKILSVLKLDPNTVISISGLDADARNLIPPKVSIGQLFSQFLDLNGLPPRGLLKAFYDAADEEGKSLLMPLVQENDTDTFTKFLEDINVAVFIQRFSQYGIPSLDQIVSATPHTLPRIYSIMSAPSSKRGYLELGVLDVSFGPENKRHGMCSSYLRRSDLTRIPIFCMRGAFNYPGDLKAPIIMIAIGGGLSPMFSLIHHRVAVKTGLGPAYLFFVSHYRQAYGLLTKKLMKFRDGQVLQELYMGFSQDQPKEVHINDLLKQNSEKIWSLWKDNRTEIFYCGPLRGEPEEIRKCFADLTAAQLHVSNNEAMAICLRHPWHIAEFTTVTT
jgi:cytochrome P450/NADPH-cytochrome P450 reductase